MGDVTLFLFEYICTSCARAKGGQWPEGHVATMHAGICEYCGCEKSLTNIGDWDWSDGETRGMRD